MKIFKVGLVGVTGYTGMELARLLASHPRMKLEMACSRTESGLRLGEFYPFLEGLPGSDVVISIFDAKEAARRCDLVFLAVPHGKAMEMAEMIAAQAQVAVRESKRCIRKGIQTDINTGLAFEAEAFGLCFSTADQKEGMSAFVEKRKEKHFQNK